MDCGKCSEICLIEQDEELNPFQEKDVRNKFIKKVILILGLQCLFFFCVCCFLAFYTKMHFWIKEHYYVMYILIGIMIAILVVVLFFSVLLRLSPYNYIILIMFTLTCSFLEGFVITFHPPEKFLYAFAVTLAISVIMLLLATQTKCNCRICFVGIFVVTCIFVITKCIQIFLFRKNTTFKIVTAGIAVFIFPLWLLIAVQLIMSGNFPKITPDDYVKAAFYLYIFVILTFYSMFSLWTLIKI